jgi:hypothetical protein
LAGFIKGVRDRSVPDVTVVPVIHRITATRIRHFDICDEAFVPNPVSWRPIASP